MGNDHIGRAWCAVCCSLELSYEYRAALNIEDALPGLYGVLWGDSFYYWIKDGTALYCKA